MKVGLGSPEPSETLQPRQALHPTLRLFPKFRELRGDDVLIGDIAGENASVAAKLVHPGNEALRDRRCHNSRELAF